MTHHRIVLPALLLLLSALCASAAAEVRINEIMTKNGTYTEGENDDWVELYNTSSRAVSLKGYTLSDDAAQPGKFVFPDNARIDGKGYYLIYCTGREAQEATSRTAYASFKLSSGGETVTLYDAQGGKASELSFGAQYGNVSYGLGTGGGEPGFLLTATPLAQNGRTAYGARAEAPVLETAAGFYQDSVSIKASAAEGLTIRYTLNGDTPDASDKIYNGKLTLKKSAALRLRAFGDNLLPSETVSATYIINDAASTAVVALITDREYINGSKGVMIRGTGKTPNFRANFEYPVHIEYFDENGVRQIAQMGSFRINGKSSRKNPQKSMALYARDTLGLDRFYYNPFENRDYDSYKALLLRAAGSDFIATRFRDVCMTKLAANLGLMYQDARMMVVYLNGEYWGHYDLREKINKYSVAQWEGVTDKEIIDNIDILEHAGTEPEDVQNGSNEDWLALMDFFKTHDLNQDDNLDYVKARFDIEGYFKFLTFEMVSGNHDFINIRAYRVPGGKWKFILYDLDYSLMTAKETPIDNYFKSMSKDVSNYQQAPLMRLMEVPAMRTLFLETLADVIKQCYLYDCYAEPIFSGWITKLEQLLPRHIKRWNTSAYSMSMSGWRRDTKAVLYYLRVRPKLVIGYICDRLSVKPSEKENIFGEVLALLEEHNANTKTEGTP